MESILTNPLTLWLVVVPVVLVIAHLLGGILTYFLVRRITKERPRFRNSFGLRAWLK